MKKTYNKGISKVSVSFMLGIIIIIMILANFIYTVNTTVNNTINNDIQIKAEFARFLSDTFIEQKKNNLLFIADSAVPIIKNESADENGYIEFVNSRLPFTDGKNIEIYRMNGTDIPGNKNISGQGAFYRAINGETVLNFPDDKSFAIFVPIKDNGSNIGIVKCEYNISSFIDVFSETNTGIEIGITNSGGLKINMPDIQDADMRGILNSINNYNPGENKLCLVSKTKDHQTFISKLPYSECFICFTYAPKHITGLYDSFMHDSISMVIELCVIMIIILIYVRRDMKKTLSNEKRINQELKLANDRIQLNEKRYNLAMEKSNSIFFEWNILTDSLEINDHWNKVLGIKRQGNYLETILTNNNVYPDDRSTYYKFLKAVKDGQSKEECVIRMKFDNAAYSWCRINIAIVKNSVNVPIRVVGVIVDIDDEKREVDEIKRKQEENQKLLQEKYAFIYRHSCDAIIDIDLKTRHYQLTFSNTNYKFNFLPEKGSYDEEINKFIEKRVHPKDYNVIMDSISLEIMEACFTYGDNDLETQFRIIKDDGTTAWLEYRAFYLDDDANPSIVVAIRDITEQKLKQEHEQLDKNRLNIAVSSIYSIVAMVDLTANHMRIINYNTEGFVEEAKFVTPEDDMTYTEFIGVSTNNYIFPADRDEYMTTCKLSNVQKAYDNNQQINLECRTLGEDGNYHWINTLMIRIENTVDDHAMMVLLIKNIDEKRQIEENLRDALNSAEAASNSKSDFLSRMSHEIRTPMNGIIGMTNMALKAIGNDAKVKDCLSKISRSSEFLLRLINDILDMSRIENGKVVLENEKIYISEFVDNIKVIIGPQAKTKGVNFKVTEKSVTQPTIIGDKLRINQIIINLLSNAIKFTPANGNVDLLIEQKQVQNGMIFMHFSVKDTGIGMSREFLNRIFKPFEQQSTVTTKTYGGTGLGLSISKNLVTMMGGSIEVSSEEGVGSVFDVNLQLAIPDKPEDDKEDSHNSEGAGKNVSPSEIDFTGYKILLVEDDDINQEIARDVFEQKGTEVDSAYNGQEAVDMFRKSALFEYDAIFMDIRMPIKNGLEATKEIRELDRADAETVPIIAMSANAFNEDIAKSLAAGMDDHISKPINPNIVYTSMMKYISNGHSSDKEKSD